MKYRNKNWDKISNMSEVEYMKFCFKESWYCYNEGIKCFYYSDMYDWMLLSWLFCNKFNELKRKRYGKL